MESAQRDLLSALLKHVYALGLLSEKTYLKAEDLVHAGMDFPPLLRRPAYVPEEETDDGCTPYPR